MDKPFDPVKFPALRSLVLHGPAEYEHVGYVFKGGIKYAVWLESVTDMVNCAGTWTRRRLEPVK